MTSDEKRPRDGDKPKPDPAGLKKEQLDRLLSSDHDEETVPPDGGSGGRTVKLAAVDLPDHNQQTLKLPALDLPGGDYAPPPRKRGEPAAVPQPPPPAPPAPPASLTASERSRRGEAAPPRREPRRPTESGAPRPPEARLQDSSRPGELRPATIRPSDSSRPGELRRAPETESKPGDRTATGRNPDSRGKRTSPEPEVQKRPTDKLSPDDNPFYMKPPEPAVKAPTGEHRNKARRDPEAVNPKGPTVVIAPADNPLRAKRGDVPIDAKGPTVDLLAPDNPFHKARREPDAASEAPTRALSAAENPYNKDNKARRAPPPLDDPARRSTARLPRTETPRGPDGPPIAESTWELPIAAAMNRDLPSRGPWTPGAGGFLPETTLGLPGGMADLGRTKTGEVTTLALPPEESARLLADGQPRRAREPSWVRFGVVSSGTGESGRKTPHADLPRGTTVGPFRLEGLLARAPSFTRYLAIDPDSEPVLVEVSSASKEIETVAFVREAQAAARLDDPHLVRVIDAGEDRGRLYIVYEGFRWRTLEHNLLHMRPRAERAARMIAEAARGLATAHGAGLAHTVLTLQDVIADEAGRTRVLGLGRPRFPLAGSGKVPRAKTGEEAPRFSPLGLTGLNTPPEQTRPARSPADAMVDVYALGSLLYTLVALRPPFAGATDHELVLAVKRSAPPFVRDETIACPPALEAIIARAMARRPERRYASCAALAEDIERLLAGQTIEAPPITPLARFAGRLSRHRGLVLVSVLALAALVGLGSLAFGSSGREQEVRVRLQRITDLLATKPSLARTELKAASEIAPLDPGLLRVRPLVTAAVLEEQTRLRHEARTKRANAFEEQALAASERAIQWRRELEAAETERNSHDPTMLGARSEGPEWARLELRRRGLQADIAAAEGEAYAARLLAAALEPGEERTRSFLDLERARLMTATRWGEPAALAFDRAAAGATVTLAPSKVDFRVAPGRAGVTLFRYVTRGPRLVAMPFDPDRPDDSPERSPRLPVSPAALTVLLPPGSYLARIQAPGCREVLYPIYIPPEGRAWDVPVTLLPQETLEPGWIVVPGGPFFADGVWRDVLTFLMTESELTQPGSRGAVGGLNAREAQKLASGAASGASLPSVLQLEKAYRGVDGRRFPWGNGFDPSLARRRESGDPRPSPGDVSPYGVIGLAGGLAEWVLRQDVAVVGGGSYRESDAHAFELRVRPLESADQVVLDAGVHAVRPGAR